MTSQTGSELDPTRGAGLPEVDNGRAEPPRCHDPPKHQADRSGERLYRFANVLELELRVQDGRVLEGAFTADSVLIVGSSFLGTVPAKVGGIGRKSLDQSSVLTFRQVVGCRTEAPEKIGQTIGEFIGGGPIGGPVGRRLGREAAEWAKAFPPIWTELEVQLPKDGGVPVVSATMHSLFPSMSLYGSGPVPTNAAATTLTRLNPSYDGVPNLKRWEREGWGPLVPGPSPQPGNPWKMSSPAGWGRGTLNPVPVGY